MSNKRIEKINYKNYIPGQIVLGSKKESEFTVKDDKAKPTNKKDKYWRCPINYKYGSNEYGSPMSLEGPIVKMRVYRNEYVKSYLDKETKKMVQSDDIYTIRISPLSGNRCDHQKDCEIYISTTDKIRDDILKEFIAKYASSCGFSKEDYTVPKDFKRKTLPMTCFHPKQKNSQEPDLSKGKQEYLNAFVKCPFTIPKKMDPKKNKSPILRFVGDKQQRPTLDLDLIVKNELVLIGIPLIKYTQFHIGSKLKIKKYLKSAVILKIEERSDENGQEDTLDQYESEVDVENDIMSSISQVITNKSKVEKPKVKEVEKEVEKPKEKKVEKPKVNLTTRSPDTSDSSSEEDQPVDINFQSLRDLGNK